MGIVFCAATAESGARSLASSLPTACRRAAPQEHRPRLRLLYDEWDVSLEREGLVHLSTYHGVAHRWTLLPRLRTEKAGLVTNWNEGGA